MTKLIAILTDLVRARFYGEVLVKFENGNISLVRKTENIKL